MESSPVSVAVTSGVAVGAVFVVSCAVTSGVAVGAVFVVSCAAVTPAGAVGVIVIVWLEGFAIAISSCPPLSEGINS